MQICWIFVCGVFIVRATNITIPELENTPNAADITLETVLGFNSTENADNINFLDKVQRVIGNIKSVFERKSNKRRAMINDKNQKFTDFIQNVIKKLNTYDDTDLKYFVTVFNDEIRKYHYRGCKFHELIENYGLRKYLSRMLNEIQVQPVEIIRDKFKVIADKLEKSKYNRFEKNLIEIINSIYRKDSIERFQYFLIDIDTYRLKTGKINLDLVKINLDLVKINLDLVKINLDLVKIIKEGLRLIIFDHYSQLNHNARMTLKSQVNEFWNYISQNVPFVSTNSVKFFSVQNSESTVIKSNTVSTNRDTNTDSKYSLNLISSTSLKQNENKFNKGRHELTSKYPVVTKHGKFVYSIKNKPNVRSRAQIITPRHLLTKTKKLTFRTLYPDFVPDWTVAQSLVGERQFARRSPVRWQKVRDVMYKPSGVKDKHFDEELDAAIKVGSRSSHVLRKTTKSDKFANKAPFKIRGLNRRKSNRRVMYHKATRQKLMNSKKINSKIISNKHLVDLSSDSFNNYKNSNTRDSMISEEGLSIESFREVQTNISHRRSDTKLTATVKSTVTELNSSLQAKVSQSVLEVGNATLNNNSKMNGEVKNETAYDKDKLREDQKYQKDFKVGSTDKIQKMYQVTSRKENKQLDNSKGNNSTFEVIKPTTYISDDDRLLNVNKRINERHDDTKNEENHINPKNIKELLRFSPQTTRDESALFNFRAMHSSNERVAESVKNKDNYIKNDIILRKDSNVTYLKNDLDKDQAAKNKLSDEQNKNQPEKSTDKQNLIPDNDFKSFISDYENDLKQFNKIQVTTKNVEVVSSLGTKTNTKTEIIVQTKPISTTSTTSVNPIIRLSAVVSQNILNNNTSSVDINQNRYLQMKTNMPTAFDAKFLKEFMKTTTKRTTTRVSMIMGRQINQHGIIFDSLEEVKQELYDTALNNVEYDYEKGKGSDYDKNKIIHK